MNHSEIKHRTENNLDALRLFAAGMVLFGHSFVFLGLNSPVFLSWIPFSTLGVYIFFTISGYLVSQSWDRDPHWIRFFIRRGLRIFPALLVCTVLTVFVLGPLFTSLPLGEYFVHPQTLFYLRNVALHFNFLLPGVFESNRYSLTVNGSLWTLFVEFLLYILVVFMGVLSYRKWVYAVPVVCFAITTYVWAWDSKTAIVIYGTDLRQVFICGVYFCAGMAFYKFHLEKYFSITTIITSMMLLIIIGPWTLWLQMAAWVLLPIVILSFGLSYSPLLGRLTRGGDYSYGVYIYAFPIQQSVANLWPGMGIVPYLFLSGIATLAMAIFSWKYIEQPALSLKPRPPMSTTV